MVEIQIRNHYKEKLETSLGHLGIDPQDLSDLVRKFDDRFKDLVGTKRVPEIFFDFGRSCRIIARQEGVPASTIHKNIIEYIDSYFEIHDLKAVERQGGQSRTSSSSSGKQQETGKTEKRVKISLSLSDIEKSARETLEKTRKRPTKKDKLVQYGPLADGKMTWEIIDDALRRGVKGLENSCYLSLADFCDKKQIINEKKRRNRRTVLKLSLADIEASARAMVEAVGRRPIQSDKIIEHGTLADGKTTWSMIEGAFRYGLHGLKDSGFSSLSDFCITKHIFAKGFPAKKINRLFKERVVIGSGELTPDSVTPPDCMNDFIAGPDFATSRTFAEASDRKQLKRSNSVSAATVDEIGGEFQPPKPLPISP